MFYGITPPEDSTNWPKAVGCFLEHAGHFVLLRRSSGKAYEGLWQLPGGKVHNAEAPHQAMHREVWEKTGLTIPFTAMDAAEVVYLSLEKTDAFAYYLFRTDLPYSVDITLHTSEHDAFRWFTPEEALSFGDLFPHTDDCIRLIYGNN